MEFVKENMFINESSSALEYVANRYSTSNLVGWKSRSYAIALIQFIVFYSNGSNTCLVYTDNNKFVNAVAPLFPRITFHVRGQFTHKGAANIKYDGKDLTVDDMVGYSKIQNLLLFLCVNSNAYKGLRVKEMEVKGLNEDKINQENLPSSVFLYTDALVKAMDENDKVVEEDMKKQAQIVKAINPQEVWLRFRIPRCKDKSQVLEYYKGTNFFPCWGKNISREMWLKPVKENGVYDVCSWIVKDYEDYIFYHNVIERQSTVYSNPFYDVPCFIHKYELTNDFDSLYETTVLSMYLEYREIEPNSESVGKVSDHISKALGNITLSDLRSKVGKVNDVFG